MVRLSRECHDPQYGNQTNLVEQCRAEVEEQCRQIIPKSGCTGPAQPRTRRCTWGESGTFTGSDEQICWCDGEKLGSCFLPSPGFFVDRQDYIACVERMDEWCTSAQ
jgi:hypothetical protein